MALRTWRYPERGLYEIRCFELLDHREKNMVQAMCTLVIIDIARKRPVRLKQALPPERLGGFSIRNPKSAMHP